LHEFEIYIRNKFSSALHNTIISDLHNNIRYIALISISAKLRVISTLFFGVIDEQTNNDWKACIDEAKERGVLYDVNSAKDLLQLFVNQDTLEIGNTVSRQDIFFYYRKRPHILFFL
jgi:DNA phosphorothioation-dependent restriction protein DptG